QAGNDGAAAEIDRAGRCALECLNLGGGADLEDAPALDGERLGNGEAVVDGDDLAVDQNGVGHLRRGGKPRPRKDRKRQRTRTSEPHVCTSSILQGWGGAGVSPAPGLSSSEPERLAARSGT